MRVTDKIIARNKIDKRKSLLAFVKNHPAKINEKELENRMNTIQEELRLKRKDLNPTDVKDLEQAQQKLSAEMKTLDNLMDKNVENGVIIEKQEEVAKQLEKLENSVNKSWSSPSLSNSSVSSSALFESFPSSVSSNNSYTTPRRSSPDINWSPPTPKFNERFTRKKRGPPPKLKKHLKLKPRNPKINKKTKRSTLLDDDNYSPDSPEPTPSPKYDFWGNVISPSPKSPSPSYESWRDDENKVKGTKQSPMKIVGRTQRKSDSPTPSPGWEVEFGNKGLPKAVPEKHKGNSPGWSNSSVSKSPKKAPKQERAWWDNQNTPSPESPSPSYESSPEEDSVDATPPPKNNKRGWLWG
jgi:hypothetical protein